MLPKMISQQICSTTNIAMILDGSWIVGGIKDPDTTTVLLFHVHPAASKDPSDIIGGFSSGFISPKAWDDPARRDAAVKFVQYMTSNEAIAMFAKVAGALLQMFHLKV